MRTNFKISHQTGRYLTLKNMFQCSYHDDLKCQIIRFKQYKVNQNFNKCTKYMPQNNDYNHSLFIFTQLLNNNIHTLHMNKLCVPENILALYSFVKYQLHREKRYSKIDQH